MVQQVVLECSLAQTGVQKVRIHWQAPLRAPLAWLGLMVNQVVLEWPRALAAVEQEHTHW